ncbi:hydroxyacid dehydrogenase [Arthrobacter sp. ISL-30]|uniref:hydroxyacid dehydrogenase n=1 Tax=Arthrobacter sp. ISL-30 TaxID=2819109 RepID=UPI001BEB120A|nr:hydroxyacid dehydrogenase [Arthrobacter sp. ISL-30]MBT2514949.1 hydroxyacid dehydrogenase [Arthrobacter sp. ISL-30]
MTEQISPSLYRPRALITMAPPNLADMVFGPGWPGLRERVELLSDAVVGDLSNVAPNVLEQVEVLITGWGAHPLSPKLLQDMPLLQAIIHQGGDTSHFLPQGSGRSIRMWNAGEANATPVAEYTLAMILLSNKEAFRAVRLYQHLQAGIDREAHFPDSGNYRRTVGIVGASRIGRKVIELLKAFDLDVLVFDPTLSPQDAAPLGAQLVSLEELMGSSDVVSVHAPVLPSTVGMIGAAEIARLHDGATLINTSRGELLDQDALLAELETGRISAVLDVATPDVLPPGHALYELPNVVLTPHIAGSMGDELRRLGLQVLDHLDSFRSTQTSSHPEGPIHA